jgi:hypothetical protein
LAYIEYEKRADAEKAIEYMHEVPLPLPRFLGVHCA